MYTKLYWALNAILISELRMYSFLLPDYSYQGFYKVGVILFHVPHTALESFFFLSQLTFYLRIRAVLDDIIFNVSV